MKQQNKCQLNLTDNYRVVPDDEIEYCGIQEGFELIEDANKRTQDALNECLNFGKGAL